MRLFVAVDLPPAVAESAASLSRAMKERVARSAPRARVTWVAQDRMHLTVRFIGDVEDTSTARLVTALAEPFATAAFAVALGEAGVFLSRGKPHVLWLALHAGVDALQQLEKEVSARLDPLGIPREERPFRPHLTLGRVRDPAGLHIRGLIDGIAAPASARGRVDAITLFESRLSPKGPTYIALQRTPLRPV
ncbi:MAG TPA: RNA 2',3'-cyclic phosphodiesterase [Vicinamibacterales bacterium]|nr:RNA 2',3'-cyclic phosphodiesterase [Vicinamibacterales bacterium]